MTRRSLVPWLRATTLRTFAVFGIAFVASIGFVVIAAGVRSGAVDRLDVKTELAVHRIDGPIWDVVANGASLIGSSLVLLPVVAVVGWLAVRRGRRAAAIILAIDAVLAIVLDNVLKWMFARDRPTLFDKIPLPTDYSFPSGHSMSAMAIWGVIGAVIALLYPRTKVPVIIATGFLIAAIGASRIYLGVHWPFDVLGGFLGGVPLLVVSVHLLHRDPRRMHDKNLATLIVDDKPDGAI